MSVILSTKLKNAIIRNRPNANYDFHLKNIIINGSKRGCSGFVVNNDNNKVIYVTTEQSCNPTLGFMYRYADSIKDYRGHENRWARNFEDFVSSINTCLQKA